MKAFYLLVGSIAILAMAMTLGRGNNEMSIMGKQINYGAFRDGVYLGTLAAKGGEAPRLSTGRWLTRADREFFADGYATAYDRMQAFILEGNQLEGNAADGTNGAAFRDGLYLGKLDAEQGRAEKIASGRWVQVRDRESFVSGYRQAYAEETTARLEKNWGKPL